MPANLPLYWEPRVEIDWANTGDFTGRFDDVTHDTAAEPGLIIDMGRDGGRSLNPPKVPAVEFELRNDHSRYSDQNPRSPVYQLVTPGTPIRVTAFVGAQDLYRGDGHYRADDAYRGKVAWDMISPRLDEVTQTTEWGNQRVRISGLGATSTLVGRTITIPLQENVRTDQAIHLVLDAVGWPMGLRSIALGDTTLLWWWVDERSAWEVLNEILASEGPGALYEDHQGILHFEGRNYRAVTERSRTPQAVFFDTGSSASDSYRGHDAYRNHDLYQGRTTALYFQTFQYEPGWRNLYARASWQVNRRVVSDTKVPVWSAGGDINITPNETVTLFARPNDPFQEADVPVLGTDYTVSGTVTVSLTHTSGLMALIELAAGPDGALVRGPTGSEGSGMQLRAKSITVASTVVAQSTIDVSPSATAYRGIQTLSVSGWPEVSYATAEAVCDSWVARYNVQRPTITISVRAVDTKHMNQIVGRMVSDRIRIFERNSGFGGDVWIESRQITMSGAGGRVVIATWQCEMCDEISGDLWGASPTDPLGGVWDLAKWGR